MVHRAQLQHHGSTLEFHLRQRKFLSLLSTGRTQEALAYAKVLGQFVPKHTPGIPQLVSLIHLDCLKTGWYTTVGSEDKFPRVCEEWSKGTAAIMIH